MRSDTNLWRGEVLGHALPQGRSDECAAQDGAHVVGHDFLLLHTAVVLQGEDHWVIRRLGMTKQKTQRRKITLSTNGYVMIVMRDTHTLKA